MMVRMIRNRVIALALLWTVCTLGAPAIAKPIDLSPKFKVGATVRYVSKSTIKHRVKVELADIDETVLVRTETGMSLTAADVGSNGHATVTWVLHYIAIETDGALPGIAERLDYDSRRSNAAASPVAPMFAAIIEQPVSVRVDSTGRVVDFQGLPKPAGAGPLDALARGFFSRGAFEQLPLFATAGAPVPAKIRTKWSKTTTVPMPLGVGSLEMVQEFAFPRIKPRQSTASIVMKGIIRKGTGATPGTALVVDGGNVQGHYTWDFEAGRLESAETQLDLSTTLSSAFGPMVLKQEMSSTIRRVPTPDPPISPNERSRSNPNRKPRTQ